MTCTTFPKSSRLLTSGDFSYLKEGSSRFRAPYVVVYFKKTRAESNSTRLGVSISKKVGKSHIRNRLKRILREAFRFSSLREKGLDILFVVSPQLFKGEASMKLAEERFKNSLRELFTLLSEKA